MLLIAVGGGVFYLYRGGVRTPDGPPQPVGAPVSDLRVAAPPQPQAADPAAGLSIYKDDPNAAPAAPAFTPTPEQPTPRPGVATEAAAAPVSAMPIAPASKAVAGAQVATPIAEQVTAIAQVKHPKAPTIDTLLADATPAPKPKRIAETADAPVLADAGHAPSAGAGFAVQIGAFSSPSLADKSWNSAAGLAPGAMAGKGKHIVALNKADGTTLYRTAITGFATRGEAQAMCAKLTAAGRACFVR
jgi:cell division protein FtsN